MITTQTAIDNTLAIHAYKEFVNDNSGFSDHQIGAFALNSFLDYYICQPIRYVITPHSIDNNKKPYKPKKEPFIALTHEINYFNDDDKPEAIGSSGDVSKNISETTWNNFIKSLDVDGKKHWKRWITFHWGHKDVVECFWHRIQYNKDDVKDIFSRYRDIISDYLLTEQILQSFEFELNDLLNRMKIPSKYTEINGMNITEVAIANMFDWYLRGSDYLEHGNLLVHPLRYKPHTDKNISITKNKYSWTKLIKDIEAIGGIPKAGVLDSKRVLFVQYLRYIYNNSSEFRELYENGMRKDFLQYITNNTIYKENFYRVDKSDLDHIGFSMTKQDFINTLSITLGTASLVGDHISDYDISTILHDLELIGKTLINSIIYFISHPI